MSLIIRRDPEGRIFAMRSDYGMSDSNEFRTVMESVLAVFVVFKLTNVINWSWFYVLMPFWIPLVLALISIMLGFIVNYGKK